MEAVGWLMVVLRIWLLLFLIYQVRSKHHNSLVTVDNVIKTIDKIVHEKQHHEERKIHDLKTIGKFKQATIGHKDSKNIRNRRLDLWTQFSTTKKPHNGNILVKEFENFTHKRLEKFEKGQKSNNVSEEKI